MLIIRFTAEFLNQIQFIFQFQYCCCHHHTEHVASRTKKVVASRKRDKPFYVFRCSSASLLATTSKHAIILYYNSNYYDRPVQVTLFQNTFRSKSRIESGLHRNRLLSVNVTGEMSDENTHLQGKKEHEGGRRTTWLQADSRRRNDYYH